ncbi:hypothetical protein CR513_14535, partial [Mucuna pruriens]
MKRTFLEKFFPASRTATILKEICGIRQHAKETLHEYRKDSIDCVPRLTMMDHNMIDVASGGALMNKTSVAMRHLISNMTSNTQQFGTRGAITNRTVNEVGTIDNLILENQLIELTSLVRQLAVEHPTVMCPTLQETESDNTEIVGAISGNQYG